MYCAADSDCKSEYWSAVLLEKDWSMLKILKLCNYVNILGGCGITDDNICVLFNLNWSHLTDLHLSNLCMHHTVYNKLTSKGMQLMVNCNFENLKELYLSKSFIIQLLI